MLDFHDQLTRCLPLFNSMVTRLVYDYLGCPHGSSHGSSPRDSRFESCLATALVNITNYIWPPDLQSAVLPICCQYLEAWQCLLPLPSSNSLSLVSWHCALRADGLNYSTHVLIRAWLDSEPYPTGQWNRIHLVGDAKQQTFRLGASSTLFTISDRKLLERKLSHQVGSHLRSFVVMTCSFGRAHGRRGHAPKIHKMMTVGTLPKLMTLWEQSTDLVCIQELTLRGWTALETVVHRFMPTWRGYWCGNNVVLVRSAAFTVSSPSGQPVTGICESCRVEMIHVSHQWTLMIASVHISKQHIRHGRECRAVSTYFPLISDDQFTPFPPVDGNLFEMDYRHMNLANPQIRWHGNLIAPLPVPPIGAKCTPVTVNGASASPAALQLVPPIGTKCTPVTVNGASASPVALQKPCLRIMAGDFNGVQPTLARSMDTNVWWASNPFLGTHFGKTTGRAIDHVLYHSYPDLLVHRIASFVLDPQDCLADGELRHQLKAKSIDPFEVLPEHRMVASHFFIAQHYPHPFSLSIPLV